MSLNYSILINAAKQIFSGFAFLYNECFHKIYLYDCVVFCIGSFDGFVSQQRAMVEGVVIACAHVTIRFRSPKPLLGRQCGICK